VAATALMLFCGFSAMAIQVGDVEIRLNGCADMAFIGQTNIVEIWIANDALLNGMVIGFDFDIGRTFQFNSTYGSHGYVNEEGDAVGVWNLGGLIVTSYFDNTTPQQVLFGGAAMAPGGLPIHDPDHSLCYTLEFTINAGQQPLADGICIDNIVQLPTLTWTFSDAGGGYPPDFQDQPNTSTTVPDAPPVCFDIVNPCLADGDVDNNGTPLSVGDYSMLVGYLQNCGTVPPVLYKCDLYGDGIIDGLDIEIFDNYFQIGMGAFICGYPAPTRCDCCKYPTVVSTDPAKKALGVSSTSDVAVTFDVGIKPATVESPLVFVVFGPYSLWHTQGSYSYDCMTYTETFNPLKRFSAGELVNAGIMPGVESSCGVLGPYLYKWQFTIAAKKGNGNFTPGVKNYCGGNVSSMVAADFNADGHVDMVTACDDCDSISCIFNDGYGQFSLYRGVHPVGFKGASSGKPASLVAGDYDMDGDFDVVVMKGGDDVDGSALVFMKNDGSGGFDSTGLQDVVYDGLSHSPPSLATQDFNGDGYFDLVAAIGDYAVDSAAMIYYENNGEGSFNAKSRGVHPVGFKGASSGKPAGIVVSDFDNDGDADVVLTLDNYDVDSAALYMFQNDGDAEFHATGVHPVGFQGGSSGKPTCVTSDFDGDGDNDIVMTINSSYADSATIIVFSNLADTFYLTGVHPVGFQGGSTGKPASVVADVDADDDMDIVNHFGSTDSIWVFENDGTGQFEAKRGVHPVGFKGASSGKPASLIAADFDGSGSMDIAVAYANYDTVAVMFGERECACITPPDSMVAWFPFDETVGPVAKNACDGNDGTHYNSPTVEPGMVQNGLCFDGLDAYVDVPTYPGIEIGTSDFTIDAWVKRPLDDDDSAIRIMVDKRADGAGTYVGYSFYLYLGLLHLQMSTPSQPHHNFGSNAYSLVLPEYNPTAWSGSLTNSFPLRVSSRSYSVSGAFYGCIDEVEVFNRVLTPQEIYEIWLAGECGKCKEYICGDTDGSGAVDIDDVVYLINYIFAGGPEPIPYESGDADCSGAVDIDDVVYVITYIFSGGPAPGDPDGDGVPDC
jgi:phosphoribosyl-AMP cyclohydrolase